MRHMTLLAVALAVVVGCVRPLPAAAGDLDGLSYTITGVGTGATAVVQTSGVAKGKVVGVVLNVSSNMTVKVETVASQGTSLNAARTIFAATAVTSASGIVSNVTPVINIYNDKIRVSAYSATCANATCKALILLER